MIPQLPSRNRAPRRREHTGSTSFSDSSLGPGHNHNRKSQVSDQSDRRETITYKHEWRIEDLAQLAAHVEGLDGELNPVAAGEEMGSVSEILRTGRKTADEMYKFDLGVTTDENDTPDSRCLSLYICSLLRSREVYHSPPFTSSIFIGLIGSSQSGREHGFTHYLWTHTERYNFQPEDNYIKVRLPTLSTLARHETVIKENVVTICIRIEQEYGEQSKSGPNFQEEGHVKVPNDMVSALGALVDVPNGADVRFVCLEHELEKEEGGLGDGGDGEGLRSRKRVICANSQVLSRRSSYFEDLFATSFLETTAPQVDRVKTVVIESADFNTVYWMIRFLYTNELLFDEQEDHIRDLMVWQSIEPAIARKALTSPNPNQSSSREWQWRCWDGDEPLSAISTSDNDPDTRSIASSSHSFANTTNTNKSKSSTAPTASSNAKSTPRPTRGSAPISPNRSSSISSRASSGSYPSSRTVGASKPYPPRIQTQHDTDPHKHPVEQPPPACAMAIYMLAHQYRLETLEALARGHILSHLTHSTCIPIFLASYRYTDLHEQVLQYIHTEWKDVKRDGEFVRCFKEVARGVWGEEGGTLLADMVSRLPY